MDHVTALLTNPAFLSSMPMVALLAVIAFVLVKTGVLKVKTEHVQLGGTLQESKEAYYERTTVRNQINAAHDFMRSLEFEILELTDGDVKYGGYHVKYALEIVFDKLVEWITFNHIEDTDAYIDVKQEEVVSLVKSMYIGDMLRKEEFYDKMRSWTAVIIKRLVAIRKMYQKQLKESR